MRNLLETDWKIILIIFPEGNGEISHEIKGRDLGAGTIEMGCFSEEGYDDEYLGLECYNLKTKKPLRCDMIISQEKYRRFIVHLGTNDDKRFNIRISYNFWKKTFKPYGKDWYGHQANHGEKTLGIKIIFPIDAKIKLLKGFPTEEKIIKNRHMNRPNVKYEMLKNEKRPTIEWKIDNVISNYNYRLSWLNSLEKSR